MNKEYGTNSVPETSSLRNVFRRVIRSGYPVLTPILRDIYRLKHLYRFAVTPLSAATTWYLKSYEYTNFTYAISEKSENYLGALLANGLGTTYETIGRYFSEIQQDELLNKHFYKQINDSPERYFSDLPIRYGRRIGWYALVRHLKPKLVIESGIDRGVGTCVLAAAILRNQSEGYDGRVVGLDINPYAGRYIKAPYDQVVDVVRTSSLDYLNEFDGKIDLFLHDSDHAYDFEWQEFSLAFPKLSPTGMLVSDNAEVTQCLYDFCLTNDLKFWYWQEEVLNSPALPGGIGIGIRTPVEK